MGRSRSDVEINDDDDGREPYPAEGDRVIVPPLVKMHPYQKDEDYASVSQTWPTFNTLENSGTAG